ncbi:MAG TPA: DMT family transporter [Anaerolineales bacterium]|nr:DMT family transporter [Anaerolineales bacterium]
MANLMLTVLIGMIGGLAVGMQGPIVSQMSQRIGTMAGSFVVHVSGAILSGALLLALGGENLGNWRSLSWYMFLSGSFGVILYLTINQTMPRLGATTALALIIIGQLVMGIVIDQFGWFGVAVRPVDLVRLLGAGLLITGGYLIVR